MLIAALLLSLGIARGYDGCLPAGEVVDTDLRSISLTQLTSPSPGYNVGEDRITATIEPLSAGSEYLEIRLVAAEGITWMKKVEVVLGIEGTPGCFILGEPGRVVGTVFTRDDTTLATASLRNELAGSCSLRFSKAKAFGVQTDMYELSGNLSGLKGQRLTIIWEIDKR